MRRAAVRYRPLPPVVEVPDDDGVDEVLGVLVAAGVDDAVPPPPLEALLAGVELTDADAEELELELDPELEPVLVVDFVVGGVAAPTVGTVSCGASAVPTFGELPPPQAASAAAVTTAAAVVIALVRIRLFPPLPLISDGTSLSYRLEDELLHLLAAGWACLQIPLRQLIAVVAEPKILDRPGQL